MKITILTLFPNFFKDFLKESIIARAIKNKKINVDVINFREYSKEKNQRVDDYQYGGGGGMVLMLQPIVDCLNSIKSGKSHVILLSPQGKRYVQKEAVKLSKYEDIIIIAGHYEGFDDRIENYVDEIISIGDYVLTGGEIPAMVLVDSITRLIDGVISKTSLKNESFNDQLLDYPIFTKPLIFDNHSVPKVLLSGNHAKIDEYRMKERIKKTKKFRNDLIKKA